MEGIMVNPEFIIFTGPMFGSKTTRLIAAVDRFRYQNKTIAAFKPSLDNRYAISKIKTHSGGTLDAECVNSGNDIIKYISNHHSDIDVIAVDEAFMIKDVAISLIDLFKRGKTIIVSSIQISSSGKIFEEIRDMMPWATKIEICPAVCTVSGNDAYYTYRKSEEIREIEVGGPELYEPRCFCHHIHINLRDYHGPH
jgi:thymidine kinase